jgi:hypothetical protein
MIEIASPATPQLSSLLPPRRPRSPTLANTAAAKNMIPLPPEGVVTLSVGLPFRDFSRNH